MPEQEYESPEIQGLFVGRAQELWSGRPLSGIKKELATTRIHLGKVGLDGDQQADLKVHGGPEKALHQYPLQHYETWASEMGRNPTVFRPGGFGENLSVAGPDEHSVFIGDVYRAATAVIQVTQGRTPCWKLNRYTAIPSMAADFVRTGRTGWYYRVLQEGTLGIGDRLQLLERPNPDWSVYRVTRARLTRTIEPDLAREIVQLDGLSANWKVSFTRKANVDFVDNPASAWSEE